MGKKSKRGGKLYTEDPDCKYLVVENPWPDWGQARKTDTKRYFEHIGAWLWYASNKSVLPLELYHVSTKDDVIIRYDSTSNIKMMLGEHSWERFDKHNPPNKIRDRYSYIFEYNYSSKGHPDNHQWSGFTFEDFSKNTALRQGALPVRQPYPPPVWADCRGPMRSCKGLAVPMSRTKEPSPAPPAVPEPASAMTTRPQQTSIFSGLAELIPDRPPQPPPPQEPAHDRSQPPPGRLYTSKLDPEYEEEAALRMLKSEPAESHLPSVKQEPGANVKAEPRVTAEMRAVFAEWARARDDSVSVKRELVADVDHKLHHPVKQEIGEHGLRVKSEPGSHEPSEAFKQTLAEHARLQSEHTRAASASPGTNLKIEQERERSHSAAMQAMYTTWAQSRTSNSGAYSERPLKREVGESELRNQQKPPSHELSKSSKRGDDGYSSHFSERSGVETNMARVVQPSLSSATESESVSTQAKPALSGYGEITPSHATIAPFRESAKSQQVKRELITQSVSEFRPLAGTHDSITQRSVDPRRRPSLPSEQVASVKRETNGSDREFAKRKRTQ